MFKDGSLHPGRCGAIKSEDGFKIGKSLKKDHDGNQIVLTIHKHIVTLHRYRKKTEIE